MLVEGFPVSLGVLLGVAAVLCSALAFSLPMLHSPIDRTMLARRPHGSVARVRHVFRDYGIRLRYTSHPSRGVVVLGVIPPPYLETSLYVSVSNERVDSHYGGRNEAVRRRFRAAVAALER